MEYRYTKLPTERTSDEMLYNTQRRTLPLVHVQDCVVGRDFTPLQVSGERQWPRALQGGTAEA